MAEIGSTGSPIDIKLGQVARAKDPQLNYELQLIYNSVHLMAQYLEVLRESIEGTDGQDPSQTMRFRKFFYGTALQPISAGAIVSPYGSGIVNGMQLSTPASVIYPVSNIDQTKYNWGIVPVFQCVALESAAAGQQVKVGVGGGVLQIPGARCGQIVWAVNALSVRGLWTRGTGVYTGYYQGGILVGNGSVYLSDIGGPAGFNTPGYPILDPGESTLHSKVYFFPVGIAIADNYVYIYKTLPNM